MKKERLKQVALRLREFRKRHSLKQDDYAIMAGLKRAAISRMETGGSKPSFELLYSLRQKYDLSIDWLISGEGPMHRVQIQNPDFGEFSPAFWEMIENIQRNKALMHAVFSAYHTKLVEIELLKSRTIEGKSDD